MSTWIHQLLGEFDNGGAVGRVGNLWKLSLLLVQLCCEAKTLKIKVYFKKVMEPGRLASLVGRVCSEQTRSAHLQREMFGRKPLFESSRKSMGFRSTQPVRKLLFSLGTFADDHTHTRRDPGKGIPLQLLRSPAWSSFRFLGPVGTIMPSKDVHVLIPRPCEPLRGTKDFADGTEVRVLRWGRMWGPHGALMRGRQQGRSRRCAQGNGLCSEDGGEGPRAKDCSGL